MIFKRKRNIQPARTGILRALLEKAFERHFSDAEVHDAASAANEFLTIVTDPERALASSVSPKQFLFAIAAGGQEVGLSARAAIQGIAAESGRK